MEADSKPAISRPTALVLSILPALAASLIGSSATLPNIPTWYMSLIKPSFTPPNWIFGPVWTLLYILMAVACYRVLRQETEEVIAGRLPLILSKPFSMVPGRLLSSD